MKRITATLLTFIALTGLGSMPTSTADSTLALPPPLAIPTWLIERSVATNPPKIHDLILNQGDLFFYGNISNLTLNNVTLPHGKVLSLISDDTSKTGLYIGLGHSADNKDMHFVTCRNCDISTPDTKEHTTLDGVIFAKADHTFKDVASIFQHPEQSTHTVFVDEAKLTTQSLEFGTVNYSDLRYLTHLGYGDYLNQPITTDLYKKAQNGDTKAQFIYALYWREIAGLDPKGQGYQTFKQILETIPKDHSDAQLWLANLHKADNEAPKALPLLEAILKQKPDPMAAYKLGMILSNGEAGTTDIKRACQLFETAAKGGLNLAQYDYGYCLYHGEMGTADKTKGERYIALAATNDVGRASMFFTECGVEQPKIENNTLIYTPCTTQP